MRKNVQIYPIPGREARKVLDMRGGGMLSRRAGDWTGKISIAKTRWAIADWTGTPTAWLRIYFDATTAPSYTTEADYDGDWGDEYRVVRVRDLYATHGHYHIDRA